MFFLKFGVLRNRGMGMWDVGWKMGDGRWGDECVV